MDLQERLSQAVLDRTAIDKNIKDLEDEIKEKQFKSFDLTIPIKSKKQAQAIYCIFNNEKLRRPFMAGMDTYPIRRYIKANIGNFSYHTKWDELLQLLK